MTREGATSAEESADGKSLYITRQQAVWRMPVDRETEAEKVFEPERPVAWGAWILAPKGIYYVLPSPDKRPTLNFFRFETRRKVTAVAGGKAHPPAWTAPSPIPQRTLAAVRASRANVQRTDDGVELPLA